jgi:cysteine desulfuration protein SufE
MTTLDEILEDLAFLDDNLERYQYLIDLGKALPPLPDEYRIDTFLVRGCTSQVWLVPSASQDDPPLLTFEGDSDAQIVRGLVALILAIYSGKTAQQILAVDVKGLMDRLQLAQHLTPGRQNGLYSMINRIRAFAEQFSS